jgi:hypothetical protein
MSDTEVESILREIREQVYAQRGGQDNGALESAPNRVVGQNGAHTPEITPQMDRLRAQTPILARSWDRLPPIMSSRKGVAAKLELWVKAKARVLMRWFTWEQVNFNAAVHQSLVETIALIEDTRHQLQGVREQLKEQQARMEELVSEKLPNLDEFRNATEYQLRLAEQQAESVERSLTNLGELLAAEQHRTSTLAKELREADERLAQEQRVCFKQLSLESSETAVMMDRTRRKLEERLAELNQQPSNNSRVERSSKKARSSQQ